MEIKPCPFCGNEATLYQNYSPRYNTFFVTVKCEMCGAQGRAFSSRTAPSDENWNNYACSCAETAWNTRAERRTEDE